MIVRQDIDAHAPGCAHDAVGSGATVHACDEGRRIRRQRTNGRHGQTMPLTVTVRRHNAHTACEKPHALFEDVG